MSGIEEQYINLGKMDYVIVTKGSEYIHNTIDAIKKQKNFNTIRIVASSKGPVRYKTMLHTLYRIGYIDDLIFEDVGLGYARMCALSSVTTNWFVFVDDDILLPENWSDKMLKAFEKLQEPYLNVGGVVSRGFRNRTHLALLRQDRCVKQITDRMFTYATIIRREAVIDWNVNHDVNAYEDYLLTQHIINKGYQCISVPVFMYHRHLGSDFKAGCWNGAGGRQTGRFKNFRDMLKYTVRLIGGGIKQTFKMNNDWFAIYSMKVGLGVIWGYLRWKKYLKKKTG